MKHESLQDKLAKQYKYEYGKGKDKGGEALRKQINPITGEKESPYKPIPLYSDDAVYRDRLRDAYVEWQLRQGRQSKPDGIWITDNLNKQWWPKPIEVRPCCREIAQPGPKWGFSLLHHCSSLVHVANLYDVDETHLRSMHYFMRKHVRGNYELRKMDRNIEEGPFKKNRVRQRPVVLKADPQILEFALSAALGKNPL